MRVFKNTIVEVLQAVGPIALFVLFLQIIILSSPIEQKLQFLVGLIFVFLGLVFFLIGINVGLLPMGESIGNAIPQTGKLSLALFYAFFLGFLITAAEPDVRVLASQVDMVSGGLISNYILVYTVALGVGIFVALSIFKIVLGIPLKYILFACYVGIFILSLFTPAHYVPVSFDSGGVTTGPLTAPFLMSLGVGITSILTFKNKAQDNFGFVALASIGPIIGVMILGVIYT
ncbi:MAG TPA: DUF1538 domain-containing protein [Firmicutes bacterium]|jgi:hypothetical protein|nr:DUF1538 domain-containing protein [Bacillota bacterium]